MNITNPGDAFDYVLGCEPLDGCECGATGTCDCPTNCDVTEQNPRIEVTVGCTTEDRADCLTEGGYIEPTETYS